MLNYYIIINCWNFVCEVNVLNYNSICRNQNRDETTNQKIKFERKQSLESPP